MLFTDEGIKVTPPGAICSNIVLALTPAGKKRQLTCLVVMSHGTEVRISRGTSKEVGNDSLEPRLEMHDPHRVIEIRHRHALDVNQASMRRRHDLLPAAITSTRQKLDTTSHRRHISTTRIFNTYVPIKGNVIIFHPTPVPPPKRNPRRPRIHLDHLPRKRRHHPLKRAMAKTNVVPHRTVVLPRRQDRIVRPLLEHVVCF